MRVDPVELAEEHPHPLGLRRHLELEQLLDREDEDEPVVLVADVVDPLGEGDAFQYVFDSIDFSKPVWR